MKVTLIFFFFFCSWILQSLSEEDQSVQAELGKFWNDTVRLVYCFLSTTMFWKPKCWKHCIKPRLASVQGLFLDRSGLDQVEGDAGCLDAETKLNLSKLRNDKQTEDFQIMGWLRSHGQTPRQSGCDSHACCFFFFFFLFSLSPRHSLCFSLFVSDVQSLPAWLCQH